MAVACYASNTWATRNRWLKNAYPSSLFSGFLVFSTVRQAILPDFWCVMTVD